MLLSYGIVVFYLFCDGLLIDKYEPFPEVNWNEVSVVFDTQVTDKA